MTTQVVQLSITCCKICLYAKRKFNKSEVIVAI